MTTLEQLSTFGYTIIKGVISKSQCNEMTTELEAAAKSQIENKTVFHHTESQTIIRDVHLINPKLFLPLLDQPAVDAVVSQVFPDGYILQNMNASRANYGANSIPHIDSRVAGVGIAHTTSIAAAFCLTDFTKENGATRIWPFSHLSGKNPQHNLFSSHPLPSPVVAYAEAGDVLICLGQTWHQAGANISGKPRWGCFTFFVPWWHKPNWDYRESGSDIFQLLNDRKKEILGFTTQVPAAGSKRNYTKINVRDLPGEYNLAKKIN
jgi:ectoine hydroxylase-related dioxygenase (phytanoyl-CoA dioxygenase family)